MENPDSGQIAYVSENNKDNDSIAQIQDPTNPLKKSSLRIVIILVVVMICLGGVFPVSYTHLSLADVDGFQELIEKITPKDKMCIRDRSTSDAYCFPS